MFTLVTGVVILLAIAAALTVGVVIFFRAMDASPSLVASQAAFESLGSLLVVGVTVGLLIALRIVMTYAITVRRLHDLGHTGWMALLMFVPMGDTVLLVLTCLDGQIGPNKYGPDPKAAERAAPVAGYYPVPYPPMA